MVRRAARPNPPEWAESDDPIEAYLDEFDEFPDEDTLQRVFDAQAEVDPTFGSRRVEFPMGRVVYVSWSGRAETSYSGHPKAEYVYPVAPDGTADRQDASDYIRRIESRGSYGGFYEDACDSFHDEFWQSPYTLLHGSRDVNAVLRDGLEARRETTGMSNRHFGAAVFSTTALVEAEGYARTARDAEGGVVEIDTVAMKRDGLTPRVQMEPLLCYRDALSGVASQLGIDYEPEDEAGIDPDTVVIHTPRIHPKYLRRHGARRDNPGSHRATRKRPLEHLYHVTFAKSLPRIARGGLRPCAGEGLGNGSLASHCARGVFYTEWAGLGFWFATLAALATRRSRDPLEDGLVPVTLRVVRKGRFEPDEVGSDEAGAPSWIGRPVAAARVELFDGARWVPVAEHDSLDLTRALEADDDGYFKLSSPFEPGPTVA